MRTENAAELGKFARDFALSLAPRADGATIVALSGELGAGKTSFVQGLAAALGVVETVSSPTFVIEKIYQLHGRAFAQLVHIDAYRLKGEKHLELLGWHELVADQHTLICIEWPERVSRLIPRSAIRMRFDIEGEGRIITVNGGKEEGAEREFAETI